MKRLLCRWETWLALAAVLAIAGFLFWHGSAGESGTAVVSVDGVRAYSLDLRAEPDRIISLREDWGAPVELEIKNHQIRYINVSCPDHICEKTGLVHKSGQVAVCMPNRVIVVIE